MSASDNSPSSPILNEVSDFQKNCLKHVEAKEKVCLPDKDTIQKEKTEQELNEEIVKGTPLKHVKTTEKKVLPNVEDLNKERQEVQLFAEIAKEHELRPTTTEVKIRLPSQHDIDLEKNN